MNRKKIIAFCIVLIGFTAFNARIAEPKPAKPSADEIAKKVATLLAKMSLTDKVGEMTQLSIDMISQGEVFSLKKPNQLDKAKLKKVLLDLRVGSILNVGGQAYSREYWKEVITTIQDIATKEKPTGIPVLYGIDAIHGANYTIGSTLFPQQLGLAATWNPALGKELAAICAYEVRASGIPWDFSPVLDIGRDPRWPRFWETFGEDVLLAKSMGVGMIEGLQGDDVSDPTKVSACMKHFLGYSTPWSGKDRTPVYLPERQMREYFLPTFQAAIKAGAKTVMINSGEINGIPVHADPKILTDLLRNELGFKGVAVTDWEDIVYLVSRHRVAKDYKEAIAMAINAGIDMSMVPIDLEFPILLKQAVEEGLVPMSRIDEAVTRILTLKYELGLFETPYPNFDNYDKFNGAEFVAKSKQAALESIILAKNEKNVLPLAKNAKILVTGPTASKLLHLSGGWSRTWQGDKEELFEGEDKATILQGILEKNKDAAYVEGTSIDAAINIDKAVKAAKKVDVVVVCLGEATYTELPGNIDDMNLAAAQKDLVKALSETGKPLVFIMAQGRPRIINDIEGLASSILIANYPGTEGGYAIADILFGDYNPNGKLPYTYPKFVNSMWTYDHKGSDRMHSDFSANAVRNQFEFGHGLSYTTFAYSDLKISDKKLSKNGMITISVAVKNTGKRDGQEVVQLFIADKVASVTPAMKRLRGFEKINLKAGETKTVSFQIHTMDLAFVGRDMKWVTEAGDFEVMVADLKSEFEVVE